MFQRFLDKMQQNNFKVRELHDLGGDEILAFLSGLGFNPVERARIRSALRDNFGFEFVRTRDVVDGIGEVPQPELEVPQGWMQQGLDAASSSRCCRARIAKTASDCTEDMADVHHSPYGGCPLRWAG